MKILILFFIFISNSAFCQEFLNLDFEYEIQGSEIPRKWILNTNGYEIKLDKQEKSNLGKSLRVRSKDPKEGDIGGCSIPFPIELVKGKAIEFKGKIKTEGVRDGYAGIWWNAYNAEGPIGFDNMEDRGLQGSNEWTEVSIKMNIDTSATYIAFGGILSGQGTAWFDDFEVFVEGEMFRDLTPRTTEPSKDERTWLEKHIHTFKTYDPKNPFIEDLKVLNKLVGDAKVVALGEVTHGSSEIFKMKHRIIKYLAEFLSFDIFSIEANMPESYKLNEYIIDGAGNPTDLIKGMYYWTWRTQEVLDMVEWMKEYNLANQKIRFTGFDMVFYAGAIQELETSFAGQAKVYETISTLKKTLDNIQTTHPITVSREDREKIGQLLNTINHFITESKKSEAEMDWLYQNIRIIEQYVDQNVASRDKYMAENLLWVKDRNPGSKIVLWAHNGHIEKTGNSMGKYLSDALGTDYITIGLAFHNGHYTANGDKGLTSYEAQDSYIGTYENFFNAIDVPIFILDLRTVKEKTSENSKWLLDELEFRNVGAMKMENEFSVTNLTQDFDLILFINESTSSTLLE